MGRSTPTTAFDGNFILFLNKGDTFNICMKEFGLEKIIFDKNDRCGNLDNFSLIRCL